MNAPATPEIKPARRRPRKAVPPIVIKAGRLWNLSDNIIYQFADDGKFHAIPEMIRKLDPTGALNITEANIAPATRAISGRKDVFMETRAAAGGQRHYRFYRQEKSLGISVLKAKFDPVIEYLKKQAALPVSMQSSSRFLDAAGELIQLLRDLEAE